MQTETASTGGAETVAEFATPGAEVAGVRLPAGRDVQPTRCHINAIASPYLDTGPCDRLVSMGEERRRAASVGLRVGHHPPPEYG